MIPKVNTNTIAQRVQTAVKYVVLMLGTAIITIGVATAFGGAQRDLAERVDRNAEVTVSGVAAIVCILNIKPEDRTDDNLDSCLEANGFAGVVQLPEGE